MFSNSNPLTSFRYSCPFEYKWDLEGKGRFSLTNRGEDPLSSTLALYILEEDKRILIDDSRRNFSDLTDIVSEFNHLTLIDQTEMHVNLKVDVLNF